MMTWFDRMDAFDLVPGVAGGEMSVAKSREEVAFELMRFLHSYEENDREKILQLYSSCLAIVEDRSGGRNLSGNGEKRIGVTLEEYLGIEDRPAVEEPVQPATVRRSPADLVLSKPSRERSQSRTAPWRERRF
jgi:hypothetical protein